MKNLTSEGKKALTNYCLSCLDLEAYDLPNTINNLFDIFHKEKGREIERYNEKTAFISWLQGVTQTMNIEHFYREQRVIFETWMPSETMTVDEKWYLGSDTTMSDLFYALVYNCFASLYENRKESFYKWESITFDELLQAIEDKKYITFEQLQPYKNELLEHFENPYITFTRVTNTGGFPYIFEEDNISEFLHELAQTETTNDINEDENFEEEFNQCLELLGCHTRPLKDYLS